MLFCLLAWMGFMTTSYSQVYPYPIFLLANTNDSLINQILVQTNRVNSVQTDSVMTHLIALSEQPALNNTHRALALSAVGYLQFETGNQDEAFPCYRKSLPLVEQLSKNDIVYSIVHGNYGMYMVHFQMFDQAIPHLKNALPGLAACNDETSFKENGLYVAIIKSYYASGQKDSAEVYQQKMVEAAKKQAAPNKIAEAYNNAGFFFTRAEEYQTAIDYFNTGLGYLDTSQTNQLLAYVNIMESRAHPMIRLGQFNEGIRDLKYAYGVRKRLDIYHLAQQTFAYLIEYFLEYGYTEEAWQLAKRELPYFHSTTDLTRRSLKAYASLSKLYRIKGMYDEAKVLDNAYNAFVVQRINETGIIEDRNHDNLNAYMTYRNQAFEQGLRLEKLEKERLNQDLKLNRMLIALLATAFILVLVFLYYYNKLKTTRRLKNLERQRLENEMLQYKVQNLDYELKLKERDITRIATDNKIRTNLKKKFVRQLKDLKQNHNNNLHRELSLLIGSIERTIDNQEQLTMLQDNIDDINAAFENKLRDVIPGISASEVKLCSLIKLQMNNQDIARILNKKDSTIRSYKYRLKKKANFSSVKQLEETIAAM